MNDSFFKNNSHYGEDSKHWNILRMDFGDDNQ